jgi:hypothetical protein
MNNIPRYASAKTVALVGLTLVLLASGSECPFGFGPQRAVRSGVVALSPESYVSESKISLEATVAPEHNVNVRFVVVSPDAIEPGDVTAGMYLSCHLTSGETFFPVTLVSDGLTRLVGSFSGNANNQCIDSASGQRRAAFWSIFIRCNTNQTVSLQWEADWVPYQGIGQ